MKKLLALMTATAALFTTLLPVTAFAQATVNVIHGIRGVDLGTADALPVDVYVNNNLAIPNLQFSNIITTQLPAGQYNVKVALAGTQTFVIDQNVRLRNRENATIIAHLTAQGAPRATKFTNHVSNFFFNNYVPVTYHHTAAAPAVDVYGQFGRFFVNTVFDLRNGESDGTLQRVNTPTIAVTASRTFNVVLGPAPLPLQNRRNYFVYVVGSLRNSAGNNTLTPIILTIP